MQIYFTTNEKNLKEKNEKLCMTPANCVIVAEGGNQIMDKYDLIALDMDGTLLNSEQIISEPVRAAIDKAALKGKTVVICTGRSPSELQDYEAEFKHIRYYICENGALIYDSREKRIIDAQTIPAELVEELMEIAETRDVMIYVASNGQHMCTYGDALRMEYFRLGKYKELMLRTAVLHEDMIASYRREPFPVEKLNFFSVSPESRDKLMDTLGKFPLTAVYSEETSIELSPLHMSKAVGLEKLCGYLSIPVSRTIAVGDSDNDAEMLKRAGLSVAMGNARPHIKELCDVVAADNDHDGCAEAIETYLLG